MQRLSKLKPNGEDRLYRITCMLNKAPVGVEMLNEKELLKDGQQMFDVPDYRVRGFQHFNLHTKPRYMHRRRLGRKPLDFEQVGGFWMLSEAAKSVIEQISSDAVEFLACELIFDDGSDSREMWLCDVTLVLDALNESKSDLIILNYGKKMYSLAGIKAGSYVFYSDAIDNSQLFRMKYAETSVICGEILRSNLKKSGIKGAMFFEIGYKLV